MIFPNLPPDWNPKMEVVAGFIFAEGKFLVLQCAEHKKLARLWGKPAGKVEASEDLATALAREIQEETSLVIAPGEWQREKTYHVRHLGYDLEYHTFSIQLDHKPEIKISAESMNHKWVTPQEALGLDLIPDEDEVYRDHFGI